MEMGNGFNVRIFIIEFMPEPVVICEMVFWIKSGITVKHSRALKDFAASLINSAEIQSSTKRKSTSVVLCFSVKSSSILHSFSTAFAYEVFP